MESAQDRLETAIGRRLRATGQTLAIAESCTGGLVGHRITNVPGSSAYYRGSIVAYANDVKEMLLRVPEEVLAEHGAVSEETARAMAANVRCVLGTDIGLSVTGIAGPAGGTSEKPVGLTYVGLAAADAERVGQHEFAGNRQQNKSDAAEAALRAVWNYLEGEL